MPKSQIEATLISEKILVLNILGEETTYFTEIDPIDLKGGEIKVSKEYFNFIKNIFKLW